MKKIILIAALISSLLAFTTIFAVPPGLQGKGGAEFPRGLENQEKIPSGWSKGEKRGWDHNFHNNNYHHHHYHQQQRHHHEMDNEDSFDND